MSKYVEGMHIISAAETYPVRHRILRPHQTFEECAYPLDEAPDSYHVGYYLNRELIGVGSVMYEPLYDTKQLNSWRIRGMAVSEHVRGKGVGGEILQELISYAASHGLPGEVWCNGRVTVKGFYVRFGFVQQGDIFNVPGVGPHVLFVRPMTGDDL